VSSVSAVPAAPEAAPELPWRRSDSVWRIRDRVGLGFAWGLGLLFCAITAAIVIYLLVQGIKYVQPSLLVTHPKVGYTESQTGGFLDPLLGTLIVALLAMAIAIPVGTAMAVWLTEYGRPAALARIADSTVEMLAGAPSIVLALFGTLIFESGALGFLSQVNGGIVFGRSFFAAGAMLSLIALPLVVSAVREGLNAIPAHVREASYAVGKTKIATTRRVLLPAARPSLITGSMLGVGRVIGDTAIILVLLGATLNLQGAGSTPLLSTLRGTGGTLTSYIFDTAPTGELNQPHKAFAAAFVLLIIVLVLNAGVDVFARRAKGRRWT
jgi:phosphate transport system permease protein